MPNKKLLFILTILIIITSCQIKRDCLQNCQNHMHGLCQFLKKETDKKKCMEIYQSCTQECFNMFGY